MNSILNNVTNNKTEISKELLLSQKDIALTKELTNGVSKAIDKAASCIIKALPVPDCAKDILIDVKDSLKTGSVKQVLSTVVKSSIREGLEMLGLNKKSINSIFKLKDVAQKGGLAYGVKNAIEVISKQYISNNLTDKNIMLFFNKLKAYVQSDNFVEKIDMALAKLSEKKTRFFNQVEEWKTAYKAGDISQMRTLAGRLNRKKEVMSQYPECMKENRVIQNITTMADNKNEKLSDLQLKLCQVL